MSMVKNFEVVSVQLNELTFLSLTSSFFTSLFDDVHLLRNSALKQSHYTLTVQQSRHTDLVLLKVNVSVLNGTGFN